MIRKVATVSRFRVVFSPVSVFTILLGAATVHAQQPPAQQPPAQQTPAQQPPAQQQPDNQQSSSQEASPEEATPTRKTKVRDFKNWSFNVGGGADIVSGSTKTFVRGGGGVAAAGVARNYSKYFGLRADFQWDNLPLRNSALGLAQAPGATSHVYSVMVGPIINIPLTREWGGYLIFGPGYFHRTGKLDSSTAVPGSACNAFFTWWGACLSGSLPLSGKFLSSSQNEFGYDLGGGVARKLRTNLEIYAEYRFVHAKHNGITTDFRPITLGVRW
jgi:opacity protein-like surface antigen